MTIVDPQALLAVVQPPTPVVPAALDPSREILLKREDLGPNGSFKWRGALVACAQLRDQGAAAVVTASTGNHGAAVSWSAARLGMEAHVVVPVGANERKCATIAAHGAQIHHAGDSLVAAGAHAVALARELGAPFLEDGASAAQLQGTATIGEELRTLGALDAVVVPLACGALAGGVARALKASPGGPAVVGVQSVHFARIAARFHGEPYEPRGGATFADGLADDRIVEPAYTACMRHLDDVVTVSDGELEEAVRELWTACQIRAEGAGAAPLAALRTHPSRIPGQRVVLLVSGANLDEHDGARILGSTDSVG